VSTVRIRAGILAVALVVNVFVAGTFGARSAHACSCAMVSLEKEIKMSDAVFSGEVASVEPDKVAPGVRPPSLGRVTFDVKEAWKGISGGSAAVYGQGPGVSCGINFDEGRSYLVYAYRSNGESSLHTDLCTATKPLENADGDLRVLGSPEDPLPDTGGYGVSLLEGAATFVAVPALLVLACVLILWRRMGRPS
jgi:hypothetical protein